MHRFLLDSSPSVYLRMPTHTDPAVVFDALGHCERDYEWILVGPEAHVVSPTPGDPDPPLAAELWDDGRISGERLAEILAGPEIQMIWGRLCGFEPDIAALVGVDSIP